MRKNTKVLLSLFFMGIVGVVGFKTFYLNKEIASNFERSLREQDIGYHDVKCNGLLATDCVVNNIDVKNYGIKAKELYIGDILQYEDLTKKDNESTDLSLDIELKDINIVNFDEGLIFTANMLGIPINQKIIQEFTKNSNLFISGKVIYKQNDLYKTDDTGFSYGNKYLPISLFISAENKEGILSHKDKTNIKDLTLKVDFSKRVELAKFIKNNFYRFSRKIDINKKKPEEIVKIAEKSIIEIIKAERKKNNKSLKRYKTLLDKIEKIAKEEENILEIKISSNNVEGINILDILNKKANLKNLKIEVK